MLNKVTRGYSVNTNCLVVKIKFFTKFCAYYHDKYIKNILYREQNSYFYVALTELSRVTLKII